MKVITPTDVSVKGALDDDEDSVFDRLPDNIYRDQQSVEQHHNYTLQEWYYTKYHIKKA